MLYDKTLPTKLKKTQEWFGEIIGRPIDLDSRMNPISPRGISMEVEAKEYIAPSPTLKPHQRIQIYNQQYWWRLLNALHDSFPFVTRLFGFVDFNVKIGFPYLVKYPPNTWSLNILGNRILKWAHEEYHETDRELVIRAIEVDWGYTKCFLAENQPKLQQDGETINRLMEEKLALVDSLELYHYPYHLFDFREEFMQKEVEYWEDNPFPILKKDKGNYYFVLFRTQHNLIHWKEIDAGEYFLLTLFQKGCTIDEACDALNTQSEEIITECSQKLQTWFQEWVIRNWLLPVNQ